MAISRLIERAESASIGANMMLASSMRHLQKLKKQEQKEKKRRESLAAASASLAGVAATIPKKQQPTIEILATQTKPAHTFYLGNDEATKSNVILYLFGPSYHHSFLKFLKK